MGNTTSVDTEKRLQLVKQIRSKYNEDQRDLTNRELILYGKSTRPITEELYEQQEQPEVGQISFFRIRLVIAVLLFAAVIFMDMDNMEMAGITAEKIFQAISADYKDVLETWAEGSQPSI